MDFSNDIMWQAAVDCDKEYDGKFFYAVKTVGVYCRPSCKSRTPLRKNVLFFQTGEQAQSSGFRPCKRCRPDLLEYEPMKTLALQTKDLIDSCFCERAKLAKEMKSLGASSGHLSAVFKRQYGFSPMDYLNQKRADYTKYLLQETGMSIIEISADVGFDSLSAFYTFFKKHTGMTPKHYRLSIKTHTTP